MPREVDGLGVAAEMVTLKDCLQPLAGLTSSLRDVIGSPTIPVLILIPGGSGSGCRVC